MVRVYGTDGVHAARTHRHNCDPDCRWTPVLWVLGILLVGIAIAVPTVLHLKPWQPDDPSFNLDSDNSTYPFVSVDELVELMASEQGVTLIDAREAPAQFSVQAGLGRTIPGAQRATWQDFMNGDDLKSPEAMAQTYRERGVMNDRPVVVYGGWAAENFWGEEGRVWWHLHWLNHSDARVLYGGIWAWNNNIHKVRFSRSYPTLISLPCGATDCHCSTLQYPNVQSRHAHLKCSKEWYTMSGAYG